MTRFAHLLSLGRHEAQGRDDLARLQTARAAQVEALGRVRLDLADAIAERERLEGEVARLGRSAADLNEQAEQTAWVGREEAARELLGRALEAGHRRARLQETIDRLREHADELSDSIERLHGRVEAFGLELDALGVHASADAHDRAWATERELAAQLDEATRQVGALAEAVRAADPARPGGVAPDR